MVVITTTMLLLSYDIRNEKQFVTCFDDLDSHLHIIQYISRPIGMLFKRYYKKIYYTFRYLYTNRMKSGDTSALYISSPDNRSFSWQYCTVKHNIPKMIRSSSLHT